jgi:hypothetical protein
MSLGATPLAAVSAEDGAGESEGRTSFRVDHAWTAGSTDEGRRAQPEPLSSETAVEPQRSALRERALWMGWFPAG